MVTLALWLEAQPAPLRETITALADACLEVASAVATAALADLHGDAATANSHGERQKKLDLVADRIVGGALGSCPSVAAWASEERDAPVVSERHGSSGEHLVAFDPLDGSASAAANLAVGTIWGIWKHPFRGTPAGDAGFLQPGRRLCAAGYAVYGPATVLVVSCGDGAAMFVHDRRRHAFVLVEPRLSIPDGTREFAVNVSNQRFWEKPVQRYVAECIAGADGPRCEDFNMRWIGCMVAEVHRILQRGGVYLYPRDQRWPAKRARLRLLYEGAPLAFIAEQAGGAAVSGTQPLLDIAPDTLHQTTPVILGARSEVDRIVAYHTDKEENVAWPLFRERSLFVTPRS